MRKFTLGRDERLRGKIAVSRLFGAKNNAVVSFPFRAHWLSSHQTNGNIRVLFVASSRRYRKAVARNRIKRVMRELYRLNREPLQTVVKDTHGLDIALMYIGPETITYNDVLPRFEKLINKICKDVETHSNP